MKKKEKEKRSRRRKRREEGRGGGGGEEGREEEASPSQRSFTFEVQPQEFDGLYSQQNSAVPKNMSGQTKLEPKAGRLEVSLWRRWAAGGVDQSRWLLSSRSTSAQAAHAPSRQGGLHQGS